MADISTQQDRRTVTVQVASELVGVSRRTIYNWMRDKKVDFIRTAGGSRRIVFSSLYRAGNVDVDKLSESYTC